MNLLQVGFQNLDSLVLTHLPAKLWIPCSYYIGIDVLLGETGSVEP